MGEIAKTTEFTLPPVAPQSESAAIISMIERMASDPTVDLERLQKILDLRRSIEEGAEKRAFNAAMAACKAELPQVVKNAENTDNHSKYATLDKVGQAVDAVIAKNGFSLSFSPGQSDIPGMLRIECVVAHAAGHERNYHADLPSDATGIKGSVNKTAIHAWGSTMTYGRRYLTMMIFDVKSRIASPDDDGNAAGRPQEDAWEMDEDTVAYVRTLLTETNSKEDQFLLAAKAASIEAMTERQYKWAIDRLNQKKREQAK